MTAEEYAELIINARDLLFTAIRGALPAECETEKRFIQAGVQSEETWAGSLVNKQTGKIRIFVMLINLLSSKDLSRTAGGKTFQPVIRLTFELFHDHLQGSDGESSQIAFESDALKIQFAIESHRNLPPKGFLREYEINMGARPSKTRSLHYARGFAVLDFRDVRY